MIYNCITTGAAGQGFAKISNLIGLIALNSGYIVRGNETPSRTLLLESIISSSSVSGAFCRFTDKTSSIRFSDTKTIHSPLVGLHKADIIITTNYQEAIYAADIYGNKETVLVTYSNQKVDLQLPIKQSIVLFGESFSKMRRFLACALIGASVSASFLPFSESDFFNVINEMCKNNKTLLDANKTAFKLGSDFSLGIFPEASISFS